MCIMAMSFTIGLINSWLKNTEMEECCPDPFQTLTDFSKSNTVTALGHIEIYMLYFYAIEGVYHFTFDDVTVMDIIHKEAEGCFLGQKDVESVADVIQNRVGLYLREQMK